MEEKLVITSKYIAKWALPNEGIPLYLIWKGAIDFDIIEIKMPKIATIREFYNIKDKRISLSISKDNLIKDGYIGFVFTHPVPEQLSEDIQITLKFLKNNVIVYTEQFITKIIRPKIELESKALDGLNVIDDNEIKTNLQLKYSGYGSIYGRIMVSSDPEKLKLDVKRCS